MGSCTSKTTVKTFTVIRIGLLGDKLSGKTSLLHRFTQNKFTFNYTHNPKNQCGLKSYLVDEKSDPITLEVWEVITPLNIAIDIAVILCDPTKSIGQLQDSYWELLQKANSYGWSEVYVVVTKSDLKVVNEDYALKLHEALALPQNQVVYLTSAMENKGVDSMFKSIISNKLRNKFSMVRIE